MLKSAILWLLIGVLVVEGFVRIKTTLKRGQRPNKRLQKFYSPQTVNQTLIDVDGDLYYTGIIHVGTPPRPFVVDFDTGSYITWLVGSDCKYGDGKECVAQNQPYDEKNSSSAKEVNKPFSIYYGIGYVSGQLVSDIVGLSPNQTGVETKDTFQFGRAQKLSNDNKATRMDGLFGLCWTSPDEKNKKTCYLDYLIENKVFDNPIFSIWLDRNASGHPVGGEIIFGGKDPAHCGDDIVTVPAGIQKPWWTFNVDKALLNGEEISSSSTAITDTGTTYVLAPADAFKKIAKKYPVGVEFDCGKHTDIELTLQIGEKPFKLTADDLIIESPEKKCRLAIDTFNNQWLLGDPFIKVEVVNMIFKLP